MAFIDLEKAYDKVPREALWEVLGQELDVPPDLLYGIRAMYHETRSQVTTPAGTSPPFPTTIGVKQGCPTSPLLFSLFFDRVSAYLKEHAPSRLRTHTPLLAALATFLLLYADDLVLLAPDSARMQ